MTTASKSDLYRQLPSVDDLLREPAIQTLAAQEGHPATTDAARAVLARLRQEIATHTSAFRGDKHRARHISEMRS